jgi:hypothetical protein
MEPGYYARCDGRAIVERGTGTGRWFWTTWTDTGCEVTLRRAQRCADSHLGHIKPDLRMLKGDNE